MADEWTPQPDDPLGGPPVVFRPTTFTQHQRAVEMVEGANHAVYPRPGRGRTTKPSAGAWGFLASGDTISAISGDTLGEGTVTLCTRSGGTLTANRDQTKVYNSGNAISGPKVLELDWTDGAWAVCTCGHAACSTFYCAACGEYLLIDQSTITDDTGTYGFDSTGTTARIPWTTPNGFNGVDDTPTTITTQYYYTFVCQDVAGVPKVILAIHFWTIDVNGDGSVILYDAPDIPGEEDGASSAVTPSGCDPLASSHSFIFNVALPPEPTATATVSIPLADGQTCMPCCVPTPANISSLTMSFANPGTGSCPSTPLTLSFAFISGATWNSVFCPDPGGFPRYSASMFCNAGNLRVRILDAIVVNNVTFSVEYEAVDCTFTDGVFHAHFHYLSGNMFIPFYDVYVDS